MKKKLALLVACVTMLSTLTGCHAWSKIAPVVVQVIEAIADAVPILDSVVAWADKRFAVAPDPAAQKQLDEQIARCRTELVAAHRKARAGDPDALDGFKAEWAKLCSSLASIPGVQFAPAAAPGSLTISLSDSKTGTTLTVPAPAGLDEVDQ